MCGQNRLFSRHGAAVLTSCCEKIVICSPKQGLNMDSASPLGNEGTEKQLCLYRIIDDLVRSKFARKVIFANCLLIYL